MKWLAHAPIAIKAGLSADLLICEAVVYDFCSELTAHRKVSAATFAQARAVFSEQQIVDLAAVTDTYFTIAMLLEMAHQPVPEGREPPFRD